MSESWLPTQRHDVEGGKVWPDDYQGTHPASPNGNPPEPRRPQNQSTPTESWGGPCYPNNDAYEYPIYGG